MPKVLCKCNYFDWVIANATKPLLPKPSLAEPWFRALVCSVVRARGRLRLRFMDKSPKESGQSRAQATFETTKATVTRFSDGGPDRAAAMAYYAIQALFPALLVAVILSLLLSSPGTLTDLVDRGVDAGIDPDAGAALNRTLQDAAERASGSAVFASIVLALTSVYSASGWLAAAGRAIEPDPARRRERNFVLSKVRFGLWTLALLTLVVAALALLSLGGDIADEAFKALGWEAGAPALWSVLRPALVLLGIVGAMLLLFRVAPDRIHPRPFRALLPGAVFAGIGWVLASIAFGFYVQNLATLGATYGAFATPIALLIWLWLSGVVVLVGAALNATIAERRGDDHLPLRLKGADKPEIAGHPAGALPDAEDDAVLLPKGAEPAKAT